MLQVVIGITYGLLIGLFGHWLLFRKIADNKRRRVDPLRGIGTVFLLRYLIDAVSLVLFALVTRNGPASIAAGISITVAIKVSLFMVYARKGGRLD